MNSIIILLRKDNFYSIIFLYLYSLRVLKVVFNPIKNILVNIYIFYSSIEVGYCLINFNYILRQVI
nr:MAG TPA: hypothetical protein [Caudoviricetes sp.]